MGLDALTHSLDGDPVIPYTKEDGRAWVSASSTRNFAMDDPLLDWLDRHGEAAGFVRDERLPGYDPRTDFTRFVFKQGNAFEEAVVGYQSKQAPVTRVSANWLDTRSVEKAQETFRFMSEGAPVLYQGVLWGIGKRGKTCHNVLIH